MVCRVAVRRGAVVLAVAVGAGIVAAPAAALTTEINNVVGSLSANGRFVSFTTYTTYEADTGYTESDVFVRDRRAGITHRVNTGPGGVAGDGMAVDSSLSADGHLVAFSSDSSNLADGGGRGWNVFVRDLRDGDVRRVSVNSSGSPGNSASYAPAISSDGRFVVFSSDASNLVPGDTNGERDVFVHDLWAGGTQRVSVGGHNTQGAGSATSAALGAGGRFVVFSSEAGNLVPGDTNHASDVFIRDLVYRATWRVSVDSHDRQGLGHSYAPAVSADGRFVAFLSAAANLVPGDTNDQTDVFVRDLWDHTTRLVSVGRRGAPANNASWLVSLTANGQFAAFTSAASNLVPGDRNGALDVFVRDLWYGRTLRVSCRRDDPPACGTYQRAVIASGGRYVAYTSRARPAGTDRSAPRAIFRNEIYLRDLVTGSAELVTVPPST